MDKPADSGRVALAQVQLVLKSICLVTAWLIVGAQVTVIIQILRSGNDLGWMIVGLSTWLFALPALLYGFLTLFNRKAFLDLGMLAAVLVEISIFLLF